MQSHGTTPAPASKLLLTPEEASRALALSPRKLWSLTASREVKSVKIGRSVRYDPVDLRDFIEGKKGESQ